MFKKLLPIILCTGVIAFTLWKNISTEATLDPLSDPQTVAMSLCKDDVQCKSFVVSYHESCATFENGDLEYQHCINQKSGVKFFEMTAH
jgi:hypothetical protein